MAAVENNLKNQLSGLQKKYLEIEEINKNLNERLMELYSLYQVSLALSLTLDLEEILKSIKKMFRKTFQVDQYSIMLLDDSSGRLKIISSFGLPKPVRESNKYEFGSNIFGKTIEIEELVYAPDVEHDSDYNFFPNIKESSGSFVSIPLKSEKKHSIGVINLYRKQTNSFSKQELSLLVKVAEQIAKVIDKTLLYKHTKELSITDELTGLYNRRYFNQRFEREVLRAKRYKRPLTAIMIDIDYFKSYNDINGHILGDEVLKKVAVLLERNIRKADILARFGGEEFVVLLPEIDKEHSYQVAEKLRRTIENNSFPEERKLPNKKITISLGVSTLLEDTYSAQELLDFADKALYEAKRLGKNMVVAYRMNMNDGDFKSIYPLNSVYTASL